jgi:hypothetical protein
VNEIRSEFDGERDLDGLYDDLQRNTWAGGNVLRGEIPRMVIIDADSFANLTASVTLHRWLVHVPGGAGVADAVYVCIKNDADAYEFLDLSAGFDPLGNSSLIVDDIEINGDFRHDGTNIAFFGGAGATKQTVFGSLSTQTAIVLGNLIDQLEDYGFITDGTTA